MHVSLASQLKKNLYKRESYTSVFHSVSIQSNNFLQIYFMTHSPLPKKSDKKSFYILHFLKYRVLATVSVTAPLVWFCWRWEMGQPLWQTVWQFCEKLNTLWPCNPTITLLRFYPRKINSYPYENLYRMYKDTLFALSQTGNHPNVLQGVDADRLKKPQYSHTMENYSAIKGTDYWYTTQFWSSQGN